MSRPTEPFPWGIGPGPDPQLTHEERASLQRFALVSLGGALLIHLTRKVIR